MSSYESFHFPTYAQPVHNFSSSSDSLTSSTSSLDQSSSDIAAEIFQAQPREAQVPCRARRITCGDCFSAIGKLIILPITLLRMLITWIASKIAYYVGVGGSKEIDEEKRKALKSLGGHEIEFMTEDEIKLEGMEFHNPNPVENAKTILICSGSHESYEYYVYPQVDALLQMGHHVLVFNYRGFGKSEGTPSEEGFHLDAEAAYQYVKRGTGNIVALGYSMGGDAATDLAAHHDDVDLFLDRTFSSMKDVAGDHGTFIAKGIFHIGGVSFDLKEKIDKVKGGIFVARGLEDETMLPYHANKLKAKIKSGNKATFIDVHSSHEHSTSNTLWFHPSYSQNDDEDKSRDTEGLALNKTGREQLKTFLAVNRQEG